MILTKDDDPIIAQCTPQGNGAIALLRICGTGVRNLISRMSLLASGLDAAAVPSHSVHYGSVINDNKTPIDHVLFIFMDSPRTFTGQDTVEITCHNNQFIIDAIIKQAIKHGARTAQEGEFTRRAFLNGKIDLVQAEAINELIHANTQLALKKSLAQLEGSFSYWLGVIEKELIRALAWCEASFEFIDDESEFGSNIKSHVLTLIAQLQDIKKTFDQQQQIRNGIRIAFIGTVNAGKSSLFNNLLAQNRSIVTDTPGTTRDVIEAGIYRNGNYWTLIDTAGLRQTEDNIEKEGIRRSFEEAQKADIIILVFDASRRLTHEEISIYSQVAKQYAHKIIALYNKIDLPCLIQDNALFDNILKVSCTMLESNTLLENALDSKIQELFTYIESPFLLNQRQYHIILSVEQKLIALVQMLSYTTIQYELVSHHLKDALEDLSQLSGKSISEAGMDMVFKEFCVGK